MTRIRFILLVSLLSFAQVNSVAAQEHGSDLRLFGQFILGVAGSVGGEVESGGLTEDIDGDLDPSIGFGAGADFGLFEYFALGGIFRYLSITPDVEGADSDSLIDIDALPRLRYPFEVGEVYLGVPVGLSIYIPGGDGDTEIGWNLNFVLGGLFKISKQFGLFAEIGYFLHFYSTTEELMGTEVDISANVGQLGLSIGAAYMN